MRRDDVASTLIRRHFGTKCPLGIVFLLFVCLPLFLLFPFTKPEDLEMWPNHFSFLDQDQEFVIVSNGSLDLSAYILIGNRVLVLDVQ